MFTVVLVITVFHDVFYINILNESSTLIYFNSEGSKNSFGTFVSYLLIVR